MASRPRLYLIAPGGPPRTRSAKCFIKTSVCSLTSRACAKSRKLPAGNFFAQQTVSRLEKIFRDIDKMEKTTVSVKKYQESRELFPFCLMAGCSALIMQLLLSQTVWKKLP